MKIALKYVFPALLLLAGCAQENTLSTGEKSRQHVEKWIEKYHPGIQPDQWGIYILEDHPGTGDEWDASKAYSYLRSTVRTIDGTITTTTEEAIAKQLGEYNPGNYYGPTYHATGSGAGYAGVEYMLQGMRVGGTRTALIPSWLLTLSRQSSKQAYIDASSDSIHLIYTIELVGQCNDIIQAQKDSLRAYVTRHYGADVKSCTYKDGMDEGIFYFISDTLAFKDVEPRSETASLQVNYTGRLLNGQLFDTSVEKDAVAAERYEEGKSYKPHSVTFAASYSDIAMDGSKSLVEGFKAGLYKMHWAGQKATVLFASNLGYAETGSGDVIPAYSPLLFELELLKAE